MKTPRLLIPLPAPDDPPPATGAARRPYTPPAILHELELETRAGSMLGIPDDRSGLPGNE